MTHLRPCNALQVYPSHCPFRGAIVITEDHFFVIKWEDHLYFPRMTSVAISACFIPVRRGE